MEEEASGPSNSWAAANKLQGQVTLPHGQVLFSADPNGASLRGTRSREALATPPVLAATQGTKPTGCLRKTLDTARENTMGNGESSTCGCHRSRRTLAQRPQEKAAWGNCKAGLLAGVSCELFHTVLAEGVALAARNPNVMTTLGGDKIETEKIEQSAEMKPFGQRYPKGKPRR